VDPYSNPNMGQPTPMMMAPPELEEEAGFDFWGVLNRRKWLVFLGLVCGMGLGALFYAKSEDIYESTTKVIIEPKKQFTPVSSGNGSLFPEYTEGVRHDRLMAQEVIINEMFEKNIGLEELECFADYPDREDKIEYIQDNLQVGQDKEEPTLYLVSYQNSHKGDAPAILNSLLETYRQNLIQRYSNEKSKIVENLLKFDEEYKKKYDIEFKKSADLHNQRLEENLMVGQNVSQAQLLLQDVTKKVAATKET